MMKILLVDAHNDIQQKWVNPLRNQGWGVVLARGIEDASRMMLLHGEGVEAFIVNESFVGFAEAQNKPFVVLTERWSDRDVMAHQNSAKPALGYLPRSGAIDAVMGLVAKGASPVRAVPPLKATGTDGGTSVTRVGTRSGIRLQEASRLLSIPGGQGSGASSVSLSAPKIKLRTRVKAEEPESPAAGPELSLVQESALNVEAEASQVVSPDAVVSSDASALMHPVEEPVVNLEFEEGADSPRTLEALEISEGLPEIKNELPEVTVDESLSVGDLSPDEPILDFEQAPELRSVPSFSAVEMTPDLEAMKTYLSMREQDVAVLTGQVRSSKERIAQLEAMLKTEKARNTDLEEMLAKSEQVIKNYDLEKRVEMEVIQKQVDDLDQQLRDKTDKARVIETRLRLMSEEVNKVKDRVRVDIRRIRVREKELEGQLEILKKDSGALLQARDEKILELKRRNDLLEFNMELVQEQYEKERRLTDELKGKLKEAAQVMKQANGFLEQ
jgi:hypothetical protein